MKTSYFLEKNKLEALPKKALDLSTFRDLDDMVIAHIEYANMFVVLQRNAGGYFRGEPQYIRSEHLTLKAARIAAAKRYAKETGLNKRPCVIYAAMVYENNPIGSSQVVETFPKNDDKYSLEARLKKRMGKAKKVPRSMRDMLNPEYLEPTERYFESSGEPQSQEDIMRALSNTKVVTKGGSKVAVGYSNKKRK